MFQLLLNKTPDKRNTIKLVKFSGFLILSLYNYQINYVSDKLHDYTNGTKLIVAGC